MGGSGSSYTPSGGTGDCANVNFTTAINSVQNETHLAIGSMLDLTVNSKREVIFQTTEGVQVGKLFSSNLLKLISCITRGYKYQAIVKGIESGVYRVDVAFSGKPR